jgi:hypothetical protein
MVDKLEKGNKYKKSFPDDVRKVQVIRKKTNLLSCLSGETISARFLNGIKLYNLIS